MDLILVLRNLYLSYGSYTGLTELMHVLQNLYWYFGSYSFAKVPVGTMSRNRSESYHIEGQIGLLQIQRLFVHRYISQIHYTEITLVITGLIITLHNLYLFYRYKSTRRYYQTYTYFIDARVPVGTTGLKQIQDLSDTGVPVGTTGLMQRQNLSDTGQNLFRYETYQIHEYP